MTSSGRLISMLATVCFVVVALFIGVANAPADATQTVTGTVTAGGSAVAYPMVTAYDATGAWAGGASANADGTYSISLAPGTYTLRAQHVESGFAYGEGRVTATVAGASVTGEDIALPHANVTGHVEASDGSPLSLTGPQYVAISVRDAAGNYLPDAPYTSVAPDGWYALTLPAGSFRIFASPSALPDTQASTSVAAPASGSATADIVLTHPNVTGTVLHRDGTTPVQGDYVSVLTDTGGYSGIDGTSTAADGTYALHLPPGTWTLAAGPDGADAAGRATVTVDAAGAVSKDLTLREPNLVVTVKDPSGATVASTWVHVEHGDGSDVDSMETDSSGVARFAVDPGSYKLRADAPYQSSLAGSVGTPVSVGASGAATAELHLRAPNVHGRIVAPDGSAIANATVSVYAGTSPGGPFVLNAQSGSDGHVDAALDDGTYTALIQAPPGSQYGSAGPLTFSVVGSATFPPVALPVANVAGTVKDPAGNVVSFASVSVRAADNSSSTYASTGSDGTFHVTVPAGAYTVSVDPPSGSEFSAVQTTITVADGSPLTGANALSLTLHTPNLTGLVTTPDHDAHGAAVTPSPIVRTSVFVHNSDYSFSANAQTGDDGTFHFFLPPGSGPFTLTASAPSGSDYDSSSPRTIDGPAAGPVTLRLVSRNVSGFVFADSSPAPQDWVQIHSPDYSFWTQAQTDDQGKFRVGLAPGTYVAVAKASGAFTDSPPVTITVAGDGSFTPSPLNLALGKPQVAGTIVDGSGNAVGNAWVYVHNATYDEQTSAQTHTDGTFSVGSLPAGSYDIEIDPPWGSAGILHTTVRGVTIPSDDTQWPVTAKNDADGKLHMRTASDTIRVTIERADHTPITSGATVDAYQDGGGYASDGSASSGTYDLAVDAGTWQVSVRPRSGDADWIYAAQPKRVAVTGTGTTTAVTLTVTDATAHVTGHLVDDRGAPIGANTASVSVSTSNGIGNYSADGPGGAFSVAVPPGSYQVWVYPYGPTLSPPAPVSVSVTAGQTVDVGTLAFAARDAQIRGTLAFAGGAPVAGATVFAYQPDGGGYADAATQADGSYTLHVSGGTWAVGVGPRPDGSWIWQGDPVDVTVSSGATSSGNDFVAQPVAGHIVGSVLDPGGSTAAVDGWASASGPAGTSGAPLINGAFSIPVVAGAYTVQLSLSPDSPYVSLSSPSVTVSATGTVSPAALTITLGALDRTIDGRVINQTGAPILNGAIVVSATDDRGNYESADVQPDGSYSLPVGLGTWHVGADVATPGLSVVSLGDGSGNTASATVTFASGATSTQTRDVVVAVADQTLRGTVKTSTGAAVPYAWVSVDSPPSATTPVHTGTTADAAGAFSVAVPAGTYLVGSSADVAGEDEPRLATVDVAGGTQSVSPLVLAFRARGATITGHVSAPVGGLAITVDAWSDGGATSETTADASGDYTLQVAGDDTWHLEASALSGTQGYTTSVGSAVNAGPGGSYTAPELTLAPVTVGAAQTAVFDSSQTKVITFGDVQLTVPAGTLASDGSDVRITASPLVNPADTAAAHPIGLGYTFEAFDQNGVQIKTRFPNKIRVTFPYDPDRLAGLGLTPDQLAPAYLDPVTNTYRLADNVVVDPSVHTVSFSTDHFTTFVLESATLAAPTVASASAGGTAGTAQPVTITGTGFLSGATVSVGSFAASSVQVESATRLTAVIPADVPGGTYTVTVANSNGASGSKPGALTRAGGSAAAGGSGGSGPSGGARAELALDLTAQPDHVGVGDVFVYRVAVTGRNDAAASGVTLHVKLPAGVQLQSTYSDHGRPACDGTTDVTCVLDLVRGTETATVRITVEAIAPGTQSATATLLYDQGDKSGTTVSLDVPVGGTAAVPTIAVGKLRLAAAHGVAVATTVVTATADATLRVRVVSGPLRTPVTLLRGSRVGSTVTASPHTEIDFAAKGGRHVAVALRVAAKLRQPAWLQVSAAGAATVLVRLKP